MISLVALTEERAAAVMALWQGGGVPVPQGPVAGYNAHGSMVVPVFWSEFPKGIPSIFKYKKEKGNLIIGMSEGRWVHQTLL